MDAVLQILVGLLGPLLLGAGILAAEHYLPVPSVDEAPDSLRRGMRLAGWVLIVVDFVLVSVYLAGGFLGVVGIVVLGMVIQKNRKARRETILWTLTVATERGLPLVPALDALAAEQGPLRGWRTRRLARLIEGGWPLPDALRQVRGTVSREDLAAIRVGNEAGAVGEAMRQTLTIAESRQAIWGTLSAKIAYLFLLIGWALGITSFMAIKILPAFQKIFSDFGMNLPPVTQAVYDALLVMFRYWYLASPVDLLLTFFFFYALLRYIGLIEWDLPGMGWFTARQHVAAVLDSLALAVDHGRPLPQALETLAREYPRWWVRVRLTQSLLNIQGGMDWIDSLRRQGLIGRADSAVLQAAQRVGNLPWALRELAEGNRRRLAYRLQVGLQLLFPVVILSIAAVVGMYVIAYFLPLISLIQKLA